MIGKKRSDSEQDCKGRIETSHRIRSCTEWCTTCRKMPMRLKSQVYLTMVQPCSNVIWRCWDVVGAWRKLKWRDLSESSVSGFSRIQDDGNLIPGGGKGPFTPAIFVAMFLIQTEKDRSKNGLCKRALSVIYTHWQHWLQNSQYRSFINF